MHQRGHGSLRLDRRVTGAIWIAESKFEWNQFFPNFKTNDPQVTAEGVPFKSIIHHTNLLKKLYIYFFTSMIFYKLYILMHAFREYDLTIFYAVALVISVLCLYFMLLLQYIATKLQNNLHMSELQAE